MKGAEGDGGDPAPVGGRPSGRAGVVFFEDGTIIGVRLRAMVLGLTSARFPRSTKGKPRSARAMRRCWAVIMERSPFVPRHPDANSKLVGPLGQESAGIHWGSPGEL